MKLAIISDIHADHAALVDALRQIGRIGRSEKRFPVVDKKAAEHDDRLTDLKSACRGAFEAVRSAPNFEAALQDVSARRRLRR